MRRILTAAALLLAALALLWVLADRQPDAADTAPPPDPPPPSASMPTPGPVEPAFAKLLAGYGDASVPPIEDLRKIHRVCIGYFSLVKDPSRNPIGGNADLAAALRGENPNRETYLPADHPVFSGEGLLIDRWGTPLVVHPQAWRLLELRSAGPDRTGFTEDDLVLDPRGVPVSTR